jgi:hypothetical protein
MSGSCDTMSDTQWLDRQDTVCEVASSVGLPQSPKLRRCLGHIYHWICAVGSEPIVRRTFMDMVGLADSAIKGLGVPCGCVLIDPKLFQCLGHMLTHMSNMAGLAEAVIKVTWNHLPVFLFHLGFFTFTFSLLFLLFSFYLLLLLALSIKQRCGLSP